MTRKPVAEFSSTNPGLVRWGGWSEQDAFARNFRLEFIVAFATDHRRLSGTLTSPRDELSSGGGASYFFFHVCRGTKARIRPRNRAPCGESSDSCRRLPCGFVSRPLGGMVPVLARGGGDHGGGELSSVPRETGRPLRFRMERDRSGGGADDFGARGGWRLDRARLRVGQRSGRGRFTCSTRNTARRFRRKIGGR